MVVMPVAPCAADRWMALWCHREALLRLARARVAVAADAEDVVQEALVRGATTPSLRDDALAPWLTRVTINLCADLHREVARGRKRRLFAVRHAAVEGSPESDVCDRAEARAVAAAVRTLPDRQRRALLLVADGNDVASVADVLGCNYKAVESLLSRARATVRVRAHLPRAEQR